MRGRANLLIRNYLSNRQQIVKIGSEYSRTNIIKYGVPQGSIFGSNFINCIC